MWLLRPFFLLLLLPVNGLFAQSLDLANKNNLRLQLDVFPQHVDFGNVYVGSFSTRFIDVHNIGKEPINHLNIEFMQTMDFNVHHDCRQVLLPGEGCTIDVTFTPNYEGWISDYVYVEGDTSSERSTVLLQGQGYLRSRR